MIVAEWRGKNSNVFAFAKAAWKTLYLILLEVFFAERRD